MEMRVSGSRSSVVSHIVSFFGRRWYVSKPRRCSAGAHIVVAVASGFPYRATLFGHDDRVGPEVEDSKVWADISVRQLSGLEIYKSGGRRRGVSRTPSPRFQNFAVRPRLVGHGLHFPLPFDCVQDTKNLVFVKFILMEGDQDIVQ